MRREYRFRLSRLGMLGVITVIMSLALALVSSIWAVYIQSFVNNEAYVGFITAGFEILFLVLLLVLVPYLERRTKLSVFATSLVAFAILYMFYAATQSLFGFLALTVVYIAFYVVRMVSWGVIIRHQSSLRDIAKTEGFAYVLYNVSYLVGPLLAGLVADRYGISHVFALASIFMLITLFCLLFSKFQAAPKVEKVHDNIFNNLKAFFRIKELRRVYAISGGIDLWWSLCYVYVPLFIVVHGSLGIRWVGYYLAALVLPTIFLEYPFGKLGDKYGFRKLFLVGFSILALAAIACFFTTNIYVIISVLALSSIGAAMVEPTTEAYFFKSAPKNDEDRHYSTYLTCMPVGGFIAKGLGAVILLFLPWNFVFLGFGAAMLALVGLSTKVR